MSKFRLVVCTEHSKCTDHQGEWDGTYDDTFSYIIYDGNNVDVETTEGFPTAENAREAGEKRLRELKGIKEYVDNSEFEYGHNVNHNSEEI